ncbi:MAG: PilZ domain-containing protein [Desulfomonilaceae bacterium]
MKRQINAKEIVDDLRSGNTDSELMEKYELSSTALQKICRKLVACQAISHLELCERSPLYRERADQISARRCPRADLTIHIPIYDLETSATGLLRDISEIGLRVAGIESSVGQSRTFQIPIDTFMQADPLLVVARCKWVKTRGKSRRYPVAGFEIMDLSEKDRNSTREFIKLLLLSKSGEWQTLA